MRTEESRRMREVRTLIALLSLTTGCAFTEMPLELPSRGLDPSLSGGKGRQVIVLAPFRDEREIRDRCGMKKNGYNMDTADAVCQSDPNLWIAQMFSDELRAAGFQVLEDEQAHRPGALRIHGSLLKLFVEPVIGFWSGSVEADLFVSLRATTETGLVAERRFMVKGWKGGVLIGTDQPFHTATHRATQQILQEMVRAILDLMNRYPQLGSTGPHPTFAALFPRLPR
jgi:hypothetical protein